MTVYILGKSDPAPEDAMVIDTTSRSRTWSRGLSPFFVGPVEICEGLESLNVENAWQFSKVYKRHTIGRYIVKGEYLEWAKAGFSDSFAHRYPMGRNAKPEFSVKIKLLAEKPAHSDMQQLNYIEARKELYIPFYSKAVKESDAYKKLEDLFYNERQDIYLRDFDGYNHKALGMDYQQVIDNPDKKMGHAFVLGMLLEGFLT
ncbi:MAG TPA: hypothetical protein VM577_11470 [Anaerovoracaceae bacterium]|nr:hypothetical protein [Anaerovoracaceae bacterium]